MKHTRKRLIVTITAVICLLAAASLTEAGQAALKAILATLFPAAQREPDVEERAREKHGWSARPINNSVTRGTIIYYDRDGREIQQAEMMLYRKYPDRLRVEITREGGGEVSGFDGRETWRTGVGELRETDAREIRMWARMWPDRLFVSRAGEARYREVGKLLDERGGRGAKREDSTEPEQQIAANQVEVEDVIGEQGGRGDRDRRKISYFINSESSAVYRARWLEPADASKSITDRDTPLIDAQVEFGRWNLVDGILWPFEVTHWRGGRAVFRVEVSEVKFNEQMPDTIFQNPNR